MSSKIEQKAKDYLLNEYNNKNHKFKVSVRNSGYDLIMTNLITQEEINIELKATTVKFQNNFIFDRVIFNSKKEAELFWSGKTKILRVFINEKPPVLKLYDHRILNNGANIIEEYRAKFTGEKNYALVEDLSMSG